jgi:translation initiation factor RLI1
MNNNITTRNRMLAQKVIKGFESRNMTGYYAETKEDALKILEVHKRYIPNIRYTYSEKYYKLLAELKENK